MAGQSWKPPLLDLRQRISTLHLSGFHISHRIVASTIRNPLSHRSVKDNLSVELGCDIIQRVEAISTSGLADHSHVFYGVSDRAVDLFSQTLQGLEQIVDAIPDDVAPRIRVPDSHLQPSVDLVHWMSLVYSITGRS